MPDEETPLYNTEDRLPAGTLLLTIIQHFFVLAVYMTYPVIITSAIGGTAQMTTYLISATLIGCGIATVLMSFRRLGPGYPLFIIPNSSYLPASLLAATAGGLPLLYGMLIISGFMEMLISRFTRIFKIIFPREITGVVLFLLGISIVPFAFPLFLGSTAEGPLDPASTIVGVVTLASIIFLSCIPKRIFRFYSTIIGIGIGFLLSLLLGVFSFETFASLQGVAVFALPDPSGILSYQFDAALLIPFLIAVVCIVMKTTGNLTLLTGYTRSGSRHSLSRGLFLEGVGLSLSGALGGIGVGTSSSNTGLIISTGIASRRVGFGLGLLLLLCGFMPVVGWLCHHLPKPILGAVLIYAVTFVMISGLQDISTRMLDSRRTFVVILPILIGVSSAVCPYLYAGLPEWLVLFFTSPLSAGAVAAVVLGLLFRIGTPRRRTIQREENRGSDSGVSRFILESAKLWTLDKTQTTSLAIETEQLARISQASSLTLSLSSNREILTVSLVCRSMPPTAAIPPSAKTHGNVITISHYLL